MMKNTSDDAIHAYLRVLRYVLENPRNENNTRLYNLIIQHTQNLPLIDLISPNRIGLNGSSLSALVEHETKL